MSYSRPFNSVTDTFTTAGNVINPCLTSFYKEPLRLWLNAHHNSDFFEKSEQMIGTRKHFTFQAFLNGNMTGERVGELPCPELCLPGQPFFEYKKFDPQHLFELVNQVAGLENIVLHKCIINNGAGQIDSYAIYGHDGLGPMNNPQIHKIYVSIQ